MPNLGGISTAPFCDYDIASLSASSDGDAIASWSDSSGTADGNCLFIDTYTPLGKAEYTWQSVNDTENEQSGDTVHPNDRGGIRWAQLLWQGIELGAL